MIADVYNTKNEKTGTVELPADVFEIEWNPALVHQVLTSQLANRRRPWAHAKDRSDVRGGGKKPWRQKGTGRARHGSIRSPIWKGGGATHGPHNERSYAQKVNKKMRRVAIKSVLSMKLKEGNIKFLQDLEPETPRTKVMHEALRGLLGMSPRDKKMDVLLIPESTHIALSRAASNLQKTKVLSAKSLNVYDLMNYKNLFIEEKAVPAIQNCYELHHE